MHLKCRLGIMSVICLLCLLGLTASAKEAGCVPESQALGELQRSINCLEGQLRTTWNILLPITKRLEAVESATESLSKILVYGSVRNGSPVIIVKPAVQLVPKRATRNLNLDKLSDASLTSIAVERERPGVYKVTFVPALNDPPIVIVSTFGDTKGLQSHFGYSWISDLDNEGFQIETSQDGRDRVDLNFNFIILSAEP
jgi:hypothetical protein